MRVQRSVSVVVIATLCLGCALTPRHQRIVIPLADRVTRITVAKIDESTADLDAPSPRYPVIEDRERIGQVIKFLRVHGNDWETPKGSFPNRQYAIKIDTEGDKHLLVWLGDQWIGGPVGNANQLQNLKPREIKEFREILQITAN